MGKSGMPVCRVCTSLRHGGRGEVKRWWGAGRVKGARAELGGEGREKSAGQTHTTSSQRKPKTPLTQEGTNPPSPLGADPGEGDVSGGHRLPHPGSRRRRLGARALCSAYSSLCAQHRRQIHSGACERSGPPRSQPRTPRQKADLADETKHTGSGRGRRERKK